MKRRLSSTVKPSPAATGVKPSAADPFGVCALATARQTARVLTQLYDSHLAEAQIEAAQFALLMTADAMSGKSQAELGRVIGMDKTTLSRNLKLLRAKGWIISAPATEGRARRISLTEEGRARLDAAKPAWRRAQATVRAQMSASEWVGMFDAMQSVMRAVRQAMEAGLPSR